MGERRNPSQCACKQIMIEFCMARISVCAGVFEGLFLLTGTTDGLGAMFPFSFKIVTELPIPTSCICGSPNPVIVALHLSGGDHSLSPARARNGFALFAHLWICLMNSSEVVPYKGLLCI